MVTMKHIWEVDVGLTNPHTNLTLDDLDRVIISNSRK